MRDEPKGRLRGRLHTVTQSLKLSRILQFCLKRQTIRH